MIRAGVAYLSEDRKTEGLILPMSIRENLSLTSLRSVANLGFLSRKKEDRLAAELIQQLGIVARSREQLVSTLSGGNQQKCVLGKWLRAAPQLLMLDEPTRGIDVGAKAQIHKLIDEIAGSGVGVLMISSELPELIGVSDRVYVLREGGVAAELEAGRELTQERVVACMV